MVPHRRVRDLGMTGRAWVGGSITHGKWLLLFPDLDLEASAISANSHRGGWSSVSTLMLSA